jgi:hypothetical protein
MASFVYNSFKQYLGDGTIDMDGDTFKIILLGSGYTPDTAHSQYSNISGNELANGNGYTTGGQTLSNVVWSRTAGTVKFDATDPVWTAATFDARYAAIYDDTVLNDLLVCLIDFGALKSVSSGTFTIVFHADGIFTLS